MENVYFTSSSPSAVISPIAPIIMMIPAKNAVDEPHGAKVEMTAHFVDKPCDAKPPQHCTGKYRHISGHIMIGLKLGSKEAEPGEESDNEEKYQRIGECEQKSRPKSFQ